MALTATAFFSRAREQISSIDEDEFFTSLRVRNRNFKQTGAGRLADLNELIVGYLEHNQRRISQVLDIGISSGITTLELHSSLVKSGQSPKLLGTDLVLNATLVDVPPFCRALVDDSGDVLQYEVMGHAVRPWRRRLDFLTGMIFIRAIVNQTCASRARRLAQADSRVRRVALISHRLTENPDIRAIEDDVMVENAQFLQRFDLVRIANVLNREYFEPPTLRLALNHITSYLAGPGALLLVARTNEHTGQHATLFEVCADGSSLQAVARTGTGSEIERLVLETSMLKNS